MNKFRQLTAFLVVLAVLACMNTGCNPHSRQSASTVPSAQQSRALSSNAQPAPTPAPFTAIAVDSVAWEKVNMHPPLEWFRKRLVTDTAAKGMYISLLRYPAGVINPQHTHPHPHGFFVLDGQLVTNRGTFGPGTFVWFPAGEVIYHGAGRDKDMVALFISGAPFEINYVSP